MKKEIDELSREFELRSRASYEALKTITTQNLKPEDLFPDWQLEEWAIENGYVLKRDPQDD